MRFKTRNRATAFWMHGRAKHGGVFAIIRNREAEEHPRAPTTVFNSVVEAVRRKGKR